MAEGKVSPAGPIERRNRSQLVAERLLDWLRSGVYEVGERLPPDRELAGVLGVGRASVREGLKTLELLGLIEMRHGEGTFVKEVPAASLWQSPMPIVDLVTLRKKDLMDLMHVRRTIEVEVARTAARVRQPQAMAKLRGLTERMAGEAGSVTAFLETDLQFHVAVAEATGNSIFPQLMGQIGELFARYYRQVIYGIPGITRESLAFHERILEALERGDAEGAAGAMAAHLDNSERLLERKLSSFAPEEKLAFR